MATDPQECHGHECHWNRFRRPGIQEEMVRL